MTGFVILYPLILTALLSVLMASMPAIMPPELPLGVRVPSAHRDDAVVHRALRRFRIAQLPAWAIAALATLLLAGVAPVAAAIVPILLFVSLSILSFVLARRSIIRAKRNGSWFEGLQVRLRGDVSAPVRHRPPILWPVLAVIVIATAVAIGVAAYPHLPDPMPVHYDIAGRVDRTEPKSIGSVFGVLMIAAAITVLLAGLSVIAARSSVRQVVGDDPQQAAVRAGAQRGILASLLSELSFVLALGISALVVAGWLAPGTAATVLGGILLGVLVVVVVIAAVVRMQRALHSANRRDPAVHHPDAPDDDRHWKGGMLYVNRADSSVLVPKRFGLGWTLNLGSPAGAALGILLLLILVGGVVSAALGIRAQ